MPGKMARSDPRPAFGLPEVLVAVSTSRLSCKRAGKTRTLMPVGDSSGESRINSALATASAAPACRIHLCHGLAGLDRRGFRLRVDPDRSTLPPPVRVKVTPQ